MWNGLKISEVFFEEYGRPMIEKEFGNCKDRIAAGLAGQGSECFQYDDRISRDHDFAPGFCLWLPEDLKKEIGSDLQAAYDALPADEFILRHRIDVGMAPGESSETSARKERIGVHGIEEFFMERTGMPHAPKTLNDWLKTPQMYLSEAVNGKVFMDESGEFSAIRNVWASFYPEDILKKKIAADCAMAGKTGQFNYARMLRRGDISGAHFCCEEFVSKATAAMFLLNRTYMPYYKWRARAMRDFTVCREAVDEVERLIQLPESEKTEKQRLIERISDSIIQELRRRGWTESYSDYLLDQAKEVVKGIKDEYLRGQNVFFGED
ncbi:MAG: DUF4037 domain-containing protein [Lachnospiraceae bacterium]|nr:DUF4037 domain-containing protein [Lachnospiraceae bacterium]